MKTIIRAAIVTSLVLAATAAGGAVTMEQKTPRLRIATEGAFAPWNATDPAGRLIGFEVDLARDLCRRMGTECEIVAEPWDGMLPSLMQGRHDAVMAAVSITDERLKVVDFSRPYGADPTVFAARGGSPLTALPFDVHRVELAADTPASRRAVDAIAQALEGRTVAVQVGTVQARMMAALFPAVAVRTYERLDDAALDLAAGRVDALLGARTALDAIGKAEDGRGLAVFGPDFSGGVLGQGVGVVVRQGAGDLTARFSRAINEAAQDGTTAALAVRWFGFDASVR